MSALVQLLPFLEQGLVSFEVDFDARIWDQIDAWRNPIPIYRCPSDSPAKLVKTNVWQAVPADLPLAVTNYAGVIGPHDLHNASIFGGEPDCHDYSTTGKKACLGVFWRHWTALLDLRGLQW